MRIYTRRGGGLGASFGVIGLLIIAPFYLIIFMVVAAILIPFAALALISLVVIIGDGFLRIAPAYRRHRSEVGPVQWDRQLLRICGATIGNLLNVVGGSRKRYSMEPAHKPVQRSVIAAKSRAEADMAKKREVATNALADLGPAEFVRAIGELFVASDFTNVFVVDGLSPEVPALSLGTTGKAIMVCQPFTPGANVEVKFLRDALPLLQQYGAQRLAVSTMNPITAQARKLADECKINLFDRKKLVSLAEQAGWLVTSAEVKSA